MNSNLQKNLNWECRLVRDHAKVRREGLGRKPGKQTLSNVSKLPQVLARVQGLLVRHDVFRDALEQKNRGTKMALSHFGMGFVEPISRDFIQLPSSVPVRRFILD